MTATKKYMAKYRHKKADLIRQGTAGAFKELSALELRHLRKLAKAYGIDTEQLYSSMGNITLWGDDTHEDFGNLKTVSAQVKMLYDEANSRLAYDVAYALVARAIKTATTY